MVNTVIYLQRDSVTGGAFRGAHTCSSPPNPFCHGQKPGPSARYRSNFIPAADHTPTTLDRDTSTSVRQ